MVFGLFIEARGERKPERPALEQALRPGKLLARQLLAAACCLALLTVGGCGQKGDLYLPDEPAKQQRN